MRITYIANIRFPTEKAHGIQIMKMCAAFAGLGHQVELVVPWRENSIKVDPFEYYSIKTRFPIKRVFSLDLIRFGRIGFNIHELTFALSAFFYTLFNKADVVFGRDEMPLLLASIHSRVVWETHTGSYNLAARALLMSRSKVIAITQGLKDFYTKRGASAKQILVAPDSVDAEQFDIPLSSTEARERIGLPKDKKIVLYTGHLYDWKGAHILAEAAAFMSSDISVVFVGGTEADIESFKKRFGQTPTISILGKKPYDQMPLYMKASDVLVLPNSPVNDISSLFTSPMKLFEYMASGRPIVASDLPSLREVLNEDNSILVPPDDPKALYEGIMSILSDEVVAKRISHKSHEDSKLYTWGNRAKSITSFITA